MKMKSTFFLLVAFFIFLCFSFVGCAGVNELREKSPNKETGEEILLGRNNINERPLWCGKNNTLVYHTEVGLFTYDVKSGEKVKVGNGYQSPIACTPDGKWLIYMNKSSARYDKVDNSRGNAADLWRYEFKTGRNEKFLIVGESYTLSAGEAIFAPKGFKLYLANKPTSTMEMPEPKWDVVWLERERAGMVWFKKPLALIGDGGRYQSGALVIDVISPYKKQFVVDAGFHDSTIQMIDAQERIYMRTADDNFGRGWQTVRCSVDVDKIAISCESIFKDIMAEGHPSFGYDITKDGDFAVTAKMDDNCVRLRRIGESGGGV